MSPSSPSMARTSSMLRVGRRKDVLRRLKEVVGQGFAVRAHSGQQVVQRDPEAGLVTGFDGLFQLAVEVVEHVEVGFGQVQLALRP